MAPHLPHPLLRALGCATPQAALDQAAAADALGAMQPDATAARKLRVLARRSAIARRATSIGVPGDMTALGAQMIDRSRPAPTTGARMDEYARLAPPLALRACELAFERDRAVTPGDVTHVVVASCTGFLAPGLDVLLARDLGLRPEAGRTLVGFQGCHAGLVALRLAESFARSDPRALVLICCVELCTLHLQRDGSDDALLASTLFADGAAAALVGGAGLPPPREQAPLGIARTATWLVPDSLGGMAWRVGDEGFAMSLSSYVPALLGRDAGSVLGSALGVADSEREAMFWAVHPGGAAILDSLQSSLRLRAGALDASRAVLARHGNMSSATILFVLDEILRRGDRGPGVALAFGPGLTMEACRFERAS